MPLFSTARYPAPPETAPDRRWDLLPAYVRAFTYCFLFAGLLAPALLFLHAHGVSVPLSLYGVGGQETLYHPGALLVLGLFFLKGIAAFGLYNEETWGMDVALLDGLFGIVICLLVMSGNGILPAAPAAGFRPELLILFPYVFHLYRVRGTWLRAEGIQHHFLSW
ncbi:hypothetical protein [Lewinella sp. IMCC34183]|uniref:hypothetical protein n=1 Tax=Lewinella sp. IMCC34183 TaxID=2248762 RepID=UPI000E230B7D|nr:hypothetical protein [Lewinella sp. IMCC34183]